MSRNREGVMLTKTLVVFVSLLTCGLHSAWAQTWGQTILRKSNDSSNALEYTFFSSSVSWFDAIDKCRSLGSELLCYKNRTEITSLLDPTLQLWGGIEMWMGKRECHRAAERWLYISVKNYGTSEENWNFHFSRDKRLWFICKKSLAPPTTITRPPFPTSSVTTNVRCQETKRRNLLWPKTRGNTRVQLECPNGKAGFAYWFCDVATGQWIPENPDLSDCHNVAMTAVLQNIEILDVAKTTKDLHQMIQNLQYGGEVATAVHILDRVEDVFRSQAPTMSAAERLNTVTQASNDILSTCDKLIRVKEAWDDLPKDQRTDTATKFLTAIDETGFLLASNIGDIDRSINRDNIVLHVTKHSKPSSYVRNVTFSPITTYNKTGGRIILPVPPRKPEDKVNETSVVFAWFSDLSAALPTEKVLPIGNSIIDRVRIVNTAVVSANISGRGFKDKLTNGDVVVILEHFNRDGKNPQCVFWDIEHRTWNNVGCRLLDTNETHTTCSCNHLTNFAVLMDIHCVTCELPSIHKTALSIITMTGCLVSIFCLSICVVIFTWYRALWGIRTTIHRNLCISLWFAEAILLVGLDRTENRTICTVIAAALHYFFLCVFFWMFLEAFHILLLLVRVFTPKRMHVIQHYLVGYGCPAIIVTITISLKTEDYGNEHFCWLSSNSGTMWSFIGPVIVILSFNLVALGKALWTTHRVLRSKDKLPVEGFKIWVRGTAVLLPLLGLTWAIGFLYFDSNTLVFAYIFAILNSLQGVGIFIFHVLLNKKIKQLVSRSFQRASISRSGTTRTTKSTSSFRSWASSKKKKTPTNPLDDTLSSSPPGFDVSLSSASDDTPKTTNEEEIQPRVLFVPGTIPEDPLNEENQTDGEESGDDISETPTWDIKDVKDKERHPLRKFHRATK